MFGEYVHGMEKAQEIVNKADVFVVVGTSLMVYPANNLILYAHKEIPKFVIDPNDMPKCEQLGYEHIKDVATNGMEFLCSRLKEIIG